MNVLFWCIFNSISVNKRYVSTHRNGWKRKYVPSSHFDFLSNSIETTLIEPHLVITPVRFGPNWTTVWYIEEDMPEHEKMPTSRSIIEEFTEYFITAHWKGWNEFAGSKTRQPFNRPCKCLFMLSVFWSFGFWKKLWKSLLEVSA